MAQINEQLGAAPDLESFLKVTAGVVKDLTQFHRVLVYQFDEAWNGQVVAELVDWNQTHDLFKGLHFPAADIPAQARDLYALNKDMTHCYLRAMSPIHLKYLENMGVRASMSVSIIAFGMLWGLVACHSYGSHGMRVSFPVRQMLRLLSQSISRNIERLSYAQRLHTRKLINTMPSDQHPSGYIVSNADDLLGLFDADYGVLVIGEGAKILGPNQHGQEILIVAEYLRLKQFNTLQVSQAVTADYPDLQLTTGLEVIAGLLYVPLSVGGRDFIAFLRKDEHLETAGVLALVYGKFIEVWRQKESALQTTKLTNILLSNASHEVRTPLNHIINYLELAMNGPLDTETRENLSQSHAASKSLLFTINDLLDLTRLESGNETSFNEPFDLHQAIDDATLLYRNEAARRGLEFELDLSKCPRLVVGDSRKIRTVVANLTANALKYTSRGFISVACHAFEEPVGLRTEGNIAVEIVVADSGCGIPIDKLESIFREFEQVETTSPRTHSPGLGLGLAVVARIVEQLGGQLRVDSKLNEGSRFSFLLPFSTDANGTCHSPTPTSSSRSSLLRSRANSHGSRGSELNNLVEALSSNHMGNNQAIGGSSRSRSDAAHTTNSPEGKVDIPGSCAPIRPVKVDEFDLDPPISKKPARSRALPGKRSLGPNPTDLHAAKLRILIVEDNDINRTILAKRLALDGHIVVNTTNGQEGIEMIESDREFDCVLMDIQMPIINGYEATERIRAVEQKVNVRDRVSHKINGRIPIFAVSASLVERQRDDLHALGMDGWILKPIDFKRLRVILRGVTDPVQREKDIYQPGCSWEIGGWFSRPSHALECAP
ncbi:Histidine protein kinase 1 [Grifola frondosa]|uniref:Histidine protein kinase 1 n=1 Tax=Grifola frondosa TaxID=5627 RepID=A0A1C7M5L4_GRIFR|nr:Histidine protein kinase 1 [Grifola frondosa]